MLERQRSQLLSPACSALSTKYKKIKVRDIIKNGKRHPGFANFQKLLFTGKSEHSTVGNPEK